MSIISSVVWSEQQASMDNHEQEIRVVGNSELLWLSPRFNSSQSQQGPFPYETVPSRSTPSPPTQQQQQHHSPGLMDDGPTRNHSSLLFSLLDWERISAEQGICQPPQSTIRTFCCIGAKSRGGAVRWGSSQGGGCRNVPAAAHYHSEQLARDYLNTIGSLPSSSSLSSSFSSSCDICQIWNLMVRYNWTVAFQGDSMTRQSFAGLECEFVRNGFEVHQVQYDEYITDRNTSHRQNRYRLQSVTTLHITWPRPSTGITSTTTTSTTTTSTTARHATVRLYAAFRPGDTVLTQSLLHTSDPNNKKKNDVVIFDHGLHYDPHKAEDRQAFRQDMQRLLEQQASTIHHPTTLVWRETSAQHFAAPGGYYTRRALGLPCTRITNETTAIPTMEPFPRDEFRRLVESLNSTTTTTSSTMDWTWLDIFAHPQPYAATTTNPTTPTTHPPSIPKNELIVIPYRDFTKQLTSLLVGNECTHYCSNPFIWYPIWRGLRLVLERREQKMQSESTTIHPP